jgi:LacI family transcriptional regulator
LNGILAAAAERSHNVIVFSISDWQRDEERILSFFDGRVDGMIFLGPFNVSAGLGCRLPVHAPCVMVHGSVELSEVDNIDVDSEAGARDMTGHLIAAGHRLIAHFSGSAAVLGARQRLIGYARALVGAGIAFDERLVFSGDFNAVSGRRCVDKMLSRLAFEELPTAVFCASDAIASGCIERLVEHGIRVPEEMSVAGFDDTLTARMIRPALTTVRQPFREMGSRAVELLLSHIRPDHDQRAAADLVEHPTESYSRGKSELFKADLVVRDSVAPPRPGELVASGRALGSDQAVGDVER